MCVTSGAGTAYPSRIKELITGFCGVRLAQSFAMCVVFCRSLFVLSSFLFLATILYVLLRVMDYT